MCLYVRLPSLILEFQDLLLSKPKKLVFSRPKEIVFLLRLSNKNVCRLFCSIRSAEWKTIPAQLFFLNGLILTEIWVYVSFYKQSRFVPVVTHSEECQMKNFVFIRTFISIKVDKTPLHLAAQHGHLEIAKMLIKSGATVNQVDMVFV